jgi:hypothetical protein
LHHRTNEFINVLETVSDKETAARIIKRNAFHLKDEPSGPVALALLKMMRRIPGTEEAVRDLGLEAIIPQVA